MSVKRIVCLANSRKLSGRCIAGMEIDGRSPVGWIRPVSAREHQEVSENERCYENGSDPQVLDVIDVPLVEPRPHSYQSENWLLDDRYYWSKVGSVGWGDLEAFAAHPGRLWLNGEKTYHGLNDSIAEVRAAQLGSSLTLIRVSGVRLRTFAPGSAFGDSKRRVQAIFEHNRIEYRLRVTDPIIERRYLASPDGTHELGECYLTVSLGEPYNGACYKLVAAIIERARVPGGATR